MSVKPLKFDANMLDVLALDNKENNAFISLSASFRQKAMVLIGGEDKELLINQLTSLSDIVLSVDGVDSVTNMPITPTDIEELAKYYGRQPFAHLTARQINQFDTDNVNDISHQYFSLINQWTDPIVNATVSYDPTLTLASFLKQKLHANNQWQYDQGYLLLEGDGRYYLPLFINLSSSGTNTEQSIKLYDTLTSFENNLPDELSILLSGAPFHTAIAAKSGKQDAVKLGVFSLIALALLLILSFKGIKPLMLLALTLSVAFLFGFTALNVFYERIHILSFAFAVSIIGISVDYGLHTLIFKKHIINTQKVRQTIKAPLLLALISTILGYSVLLISPLDFLKQVVVFVCFGLIGAFLTAYWLIPEIESKKSDLYFSFAFKRRYSYLIVAFTIAVSGLFALEFDDDISLLITKNDQLLTSEHQIKELTGNNSYPSLILTYDVDPSGLLDKNKSLVSALEKWGGSHQVITSLSDWYTTTPYQNDNIKRVVNFWSKHSDSQLASYVDFSDVEKIASQATLTDLPPDSILTHLGIEMVEQGGKFWTLIVVDSPLSTQQKSIVDQSEHADIINIAKDISTRLSEFRNDTIALVIPAIVLIFLALAIYFNWKKALIISTTFAITAILALAISYLFQGELNVFNIISCALVITLTLDYMIFFHEHGDCKVVSHTVSLSAVTSALTFGVMTFSSTPAVSNFGFTLFVGVFIGWILSHLTPIPNNISKEKL